MEQQHGGFDMNRQMAYVSNLVGDKAMRVIAWVLVIVAVISLVYIVIGLFNKTKSFKEFGTWIDIGMTGVMFVAGCALITKIPKQ